MSWVDGVQSLGAILSTVSPRVLSHSSRGLARKETANEEKKKRIIGKLGNSSHVSEQCSLLACHA